MESNTNPRSAQAQSAKSKSNTPPKSHDPQPLTSPRIARTAGAHILQRGGVIRGLTNWGVFHLPNPTRGRKGKQTHYAGHYFLLRFDASAKTQHGLRRMLGLEPRLLRFSVVKMGEGLRGIADVGGEAEEWKGVEGARGERPVERRAEGDYYIT